MSDRMDWLFGKTTTSTENAQSARMQWLTETPDETKREEKTNTAAVVAPSVVSADSSPGGTTVDQNGFSGTSGKMAKAVAQNVQSLPADLTIAEHTKLMSEAETRLAALEDEWRYKNRYTYEEKQSYIDEKNALEQQIEASKAGIWRLEREEKYGGLKDNDDYAEKSKTIDDSRKHTVGINIGENYIGFGDPVYAYIFDLNGAGKMTEGGTKSNLAGPDIGGEGYDPEAPASYLKYSFMNQEEKNNYNYLYQTQGKKAAEEYLEYISYDLNARRAGKYAQGWKEYTDKGIIPSAIASAASVGSNIISGVGLVDIFSQNLERDITGEYKPIDYNSLSMNPAIATTTIRGNVASNIADATGTIKLNEVEHPVLSRIFNGKSLGDVYQLGMSVADSLTVAYLTPFGKYGAVLLGGSAGTQGVLDALERGATDEQALRMGLLNGTFEALFEYVSLDKLLTSEPRKLVMALLRQGGVEASEEACTTLANDIADILVMAERSDYELKIKAYMESGMSREKAAKQALLDKCIELGWDAVGGFFSGGLSGGFSAAVSGSSTHRTAPVQTETQAQTRTEEQLLAEAQDRASQQTIEEGPAGVSPAAKPLNPGQQTEEAEQNVAVLRSAEERDTVEEKNRRIARAVELAAQGKTPSQIFQETGLVTKANGDITDGFGGEVIWRNNGQQRISDRGTAEIKTEGKTQTEVPSDDGRGDAGGLLPQTGRSSYASLTQQQRDRTREAIILRLREANREESFILLEEYGDDAELAQEIYNDYAAGDVALEQWAEFFGDTEGLARELDEIISPLTQQKGSPFGGAVERSETEGATAAKPTDPAEAAVEQEYRRLVENAITEGDYQRAVALYREYNNPALRAYKEFYTLKTFSEYAAAQGYIPATDTALGTDGIKNTDKDISNQLETLEKSEGSDYNTSEENILSLALRFVSNRDELYTYLQKVPPLDGYEDILCHADARSFGFLDPVTGETVQDVDASFLAKRIVESGKFNGGPIRLFSCEAGKYEDGPAQKLADELGVNVLAPTQAVFIHPMGYVAVADSEEEAKQLFASSTKKWNPERWKEFIPKEENHDLYRL